MMKTTRSQTTTTTADTNNQTTSTSSSPLQTDGDSGLLSSELEMNDVQIVDIKNIKKFTRQEAEAGVDSLDLDSGRPSSIASGGDKTVTIDGSIHDGFDIDDLDEDYSKKSYKEGYEVSDSNDVSMQLDLEDEDIFDPKDDNMFSALNIKLEKIKNDTDKVTPNIVKNTTEFFEEINQPQGRDNSIDKAAKELEKDKADSSKPSECNLKSDDAKKDKKDKTKEEDQSDLSRAPIIDLQTKDISTGEIEKTLKADESKSNSDKLECSKFEDLPAKHASTENSENGENRNKNATRPSSSSPMEVKIAANQEDSKRLKDSEFNKETFHIH